MASRRPQISLVRAFMLMTIIALIFVVVRQHRELSAIRQDQLTLPSIWKRRFPVLSESTLQAWHMVDIEALLWTWKIWVPSDARVALRFKWGGITADGYPDNAISVDLPAGGNWLALDFHEHQASGELLGELFHPASVYRFVVPSSERLFPNWNSEYRTDVVGVHRLTESADGRLLLQRFRIAGDDAAADFAAPGFVIWLERR